LALGTPEAIVLPERAMEDLRERARLIWAREERCPICGDRPLEAVNEDKMYAHLLEHRIRFLEKVIRLYCDCDCEKPPRPGQSHWTFCRRKIGDSALVAPLEQMVPEGGK